MNKIIAAKTPCISSHNENILHGTNIARLAELDLFAFASTEAISNSRKKRKSNTDLPSYYSHMAILIQSSLSHNH